MPKEDAIIPAYRLETAVKKIIYWSVPHHVAEKIRQKIWASTRIKRHIFEEMEDAW